MPSTSTDLTFINQLIGFDAQYQNQHNKAESNTERKTETVWVIGADEVGRGSCIGSVVAGAVVTPTNISEDLKNELAELNDSKQLSAKQRQSIYNTLIKAQQPNSPSPKSTSKLQITKPLIMSAIGEASQDEVDAHNVYQASLLAIHRAVESILTEHRWLQQAPLVLLLDGKATLPDRWLPKQAKQLTQHAIIKGDGKSFAIAAASVLAKHHRDSIITEWAADYPQYGWETNMGYPTPAHKRALKEYGPSPYHRRSYKVVQEALEAKEQQLLLTAPN